jgi:hypothetical protein
MLQGIPIWQAVIDSSGPVSCEAISLQSAASAAKRMADAGQKVVALTDGENTIEGEQFRVLLENPNAIHMFGGKLYRS